MMQVANLKAEPDARGNSIVLSWDNPTDAGFSSVKILRRESTFPILPDDIGTPFEVFSDTTPQAGTQENFRDTRLRGGTTYYYAVVAQGGSSPGIPVFITALATSSFKTGSYLYKNLPEIYRTFDTTTAPPELLGSLDVADQSKGQLQRFVEMFGAQFDLLRSFAGSVLDFQDTSKVDGNLLPLLAQWIGWQSDFTQTIPKQRNEVQYAPHFYRTLGIPANLRAMINRVSTWDAVIKEFAHNIFRAGDPEQLMIAEVKRTGTNWVSQGPVTLDVAHEGRVSSLLAADGRPFIFYHVKENVPSATPGTPTTTRWHLLYKAFEQGNWSGAHRLTIGDRVDRWPAAVQRADGSVWVFHSGYEDSGARLVPQLKLQVMSVGRGALPARVQGTVSGPFAVTDGDQFKVVITDGAQVVNRTVTLRSEDFSGVSPVSADAMARVLDRELPYLDVRVENGQIVLKSLKAGLGTSLQIPTSTVATTLGIAAPLTATGTSALAGAITGALNEPFALADQDQIALLQNGNPVRVITFSKNNFNAIGAAKAAEVVAVINAVIPNAASVSGTQVVLHSNGAGEAALISVDVNASSAAAKLGFGVAPPNAAGVDECEPSVFRDATDNVWLFWSSRRSGDWKIWFNQLNGNAWAAPKQLTTGTLPDRECGALLDADAGRIWVFWSRYKQNGLWNIFFRDTTKLNFSTLADGDWTEAELQPLSPTPPAGYDNREPTPLLLGNDSLELYFGSNRSNGWNSYAKPISSAAQGADAQITFGQFTQRAPSPLKTSANEVRVFFRSNETQFYTSKLYVSAQTVDGRFAGSTTADTRNPARLSLRGNIKDIQHYTYHGPIHDPTLIADQIAQLEEKRLYSRDTVGVYLVPDTTDADLIIRNTKFMGEILRQFLPIQVRVVFLIDQAFTEFVYDYQGNGQSAPLIQERMIDTILSDVLAPITDSFADTGGFKFIRTWDPSLNPGVMPDLSVHPPDISLRMPIAGLGEEK